MKNLEQHGPWWLDTSWWCRCSSLQECSRRSGPRTCTGTSSPFASAARWSLCRGSSAWLSGKQQTLRPRPRPTLSRGSAVHRSDEMFTQGKSYLGWLRGGPIRTHLLREKEERKAVHLRVTPLAVVVRMARAPEHICGLQRICHLRCHSQRGGKLLDCGVQRGGAGAGLGLQTQTSVYDLTVWLQREKLQAKKKKRIVTGQAGGNRGVRLPALWVKRKVQH